MTGNGQRSTYKIGDDWGMVYGTVLTALVGRFPRLDFPGELLKKFAEESADPQIPPGISKNLLMKKFHVQISCIHVYIYIYTYASPPPKKKPPRLWMHALGK